MIFLSIILHLQNVINQVLRVRFSDQNRLSLVILGEAGFNIHRKSNLKLLIGQAVVKLSSVDEVDPFFCQIFTLELLEAAAAAGKESNFGSG